MSSLIVVNRSQYHHGGIIRTLFLVQRVVQQIGEKARPRIRLVEERFGPATCGSSRPSVPATQGDNKPLPGTWQPIPKNFFHNLGCHRLLLRGNAKHDGTLPQHPRGSHLRSRPLQREVPSQRGLPSSSRFRNKRFKDKKQFFHKGCNIYLFFYHHLGLYLAGQDILTAGFTSALLSGLMCASAALDANLFTDLLNLHMKTKNDAPHEKKH